MRYIYVVDLHAVIIVYTSPKTAGAGLPTLGLFRRGPLHSEAEPERLEAPEGGGHERQALGRDLKGLTHAVDICLLCLLLYIVIFERLSDSKT